MSGAIETVGYIIEPTDYSNADRGEEGQIVLTFEAAPGADPDTSSHIYIEMSKDRALEVISDLTRVLREGV